MAVKMKWVSDIDRTVLVSNFERLGWARGTTEGREGKLRNYGYYRVLKHSTITYLTVQLIVFRVV